MFVLPPQSPKITTPAAGSATRAAILDAIRPHAFRPGAARREFNVSFIRSDGTAAVVRCAPTGEHDAAWSSRFNVTGDLSTFFLRRRAKGWRLLGSVADFHEGGLISIYDLRPLGPLRFPMRLLAGSDDGGHAIAAKGRYLFAFDERFRPMPITPAQAATVARAKDNAKLDGRYAQINQFRP